MCRRHAPGGTIHPPLAGGNSGSLWRLLDARCASPDPDTRSTSTPPESFGPMGRAAGRFGVTFNGPAARGAAPTNSGRSWRGGPNVTRISSSSPQTSHSTRWTPSTGGRRGYRCRHWSVKYSRSSASMRVLRIPGASLVLELSAIGTQKPPFGGWSGFWKCLARALRNVSPETPGLRRDGRILAQRFV